jgi:hypothetical protein
MRATIRFFEWDDLRPDHPRDQPVNLVLQIGPLNEPGTETFQLSICTVEAIAALVGRDGMVFGRHLLIVGDVNPARIEAFLRDRLSRLEGKSWPELSEKIARIAHSEFEDHREYRSAD